MPRIRWALLGWSLAASAGCLGAPALASNGEVPAQQSPQLIPRSPAQRERTNELERRINLHVVVTDASGKRVMGLTAQDFTVLDRGQPQKMARFEEVKGPAVQNVAVHALVVLDAINDGRAGANRVRKELVRLLGQGRGPLLFPLQIVVVSDSGFTEGTPTKDRTALINDMTQLTRNLQSTDCDVQAEGPDLLRSPVPAQADSGQARWDCLNAHLMKSLNALDRLAQGQRKVNGRAIVIWTGPGWPLPRQFDTGQIMPGGGVKGDLSDAVVAIESRMQEGQVTLDAVTWGSFERAQGVRRVGLRGSLAGASLTEQETALELPALAEQTGGLALAKSKNLADALNTCLGDGEQYYAIAFDPAPAAAQDEYRPIEVKVNRPSTTVRTLTGYYAEP